MPEFLVYGSFPALSGGHRLLWPGRLLPELERQVEQACRSFGDRLGPFDRALYSRKLPGRRWLVAVVADNGADAHGRKGALVHQCLVLDHDEYAAAGFDPFVIEQAGWFRDRVWSGREEPELQEAHRARRNAPAQRVAAGPMADSRAGLAELQEAQRLARGLRRRGRMRIEAPVARPGLLRAVLAASDSALRSQLEVCSLCFNADPPFDLELRYTDVPLARLAAPARRRWRGLALGLGLLCACSALGLAAWRGAPPPPDGLPRLDPPPAPEAPVLPDPLRFLLSADRLDQAVKAIRSLDRYRGRALADRLEMPGSSRRELLDEIIFDYGNALDQFDRLRVHLLERQRAAQRERKP